MRPVTVTVGPLATAIANAICLSQTPAAGALTLNGALVTSGVAVMDQPRRVLITATGNESAKTFTITGTNWSGQVWGETITGPNATTTQSVLDYATVTSITISAAAANALTIGTSGVASSPWVRLDHWSQPETSIQATVTGTVNYTVQQTLQDPNSSTNPVTPSLITWVNSSDPNMVGATGTIQSNYAFAPTFTRITLNSGTGSVSGVFAQSGIVPF
jgi:hypothetical protein